MYRFRFALGAVVAAAFLAPMPVLAVQPTREPLPSGTFTISGSCEFDVLAETISNKEYVTTFASGKQIITGQLVVRLTNLSDPTKSVVINISGPGIEDDPSVFNLSGTSLVFFPGVLVLTRGPVSISFDSNGNLVFTQTSASSLDLCAVLADP